MALPTTAYLTEKISETNDIGKYIFNSSNNSGDGYGNTTDDISVINNNIKAYFFLDLLMIAEKDNIKGFVGLVKDPSINKSYHNPLRFSNMRLTKDNDTYIVLKDAGLNTYGIGGIDNVLSSSSTSKDDLYENFPPRITDTTIYYSFKSAYYLDSTIKVYIESESVPNDWIEVYSGTLSQKGQLADKVAIDVINKSGDHRFKAVNTNSEGDFISDIVSVFIKMISATFKYSDISASDAKNNGVNRLRYYNTRELLDAENNGSDATQIFKDETSTPEHTENGYYVLSDKWYQYGYDTLTDRYCILKKGNAETGGYPIGDSGNIVTTEEGIDYNGYDKDFQSEADLEVNSGNYQSGTLYKVITANYDTNPITETTIFYTSADKTTFASEGYYSIGDMVFGVTRQISVGGNGVMIYDNNI